MQNAAGAHFQHRVPGVAAPRHQRQHAVKLPALQGVRGLHGRRAGGVDNAQGATGHGQARLVQQPGRQHRLWQGQRQPMLATGHDQRIHIGPCQARATGRLADQRVGKAERLNQLPESRGQRSFFTLAQQGWRHVVSQQALDAVFKNIAHVVLP